MFRSILLVLSACFGLTNVTAQTLNQQISWSEFYGGSAGYIPYNMHPYNDGYAMLGQCYFGLSHISLPLTLITTDKNGLKTNRFLLENIGRQNYPLDFLVSNEGNFIIFGNSNCFNPTHPNTPLDIYGPEELFIMSVNPEGNVLWEHCLGSKDRESPMKILKVPDGSGFYLIASTNASESSGNVTQASKGLNDLWIMKMDFNGNLIWERYFGGSEDENAIDAFINLSGNLEILVYSESKDFDLSNQPDSTNFFFLTTNSDGTNVSTHTFFNNYFGEDYFRVHEVIQAKNGNYVLAGLYQYENDEPFVPGEFKLPITDAGIGIVDSTGTLTLFKRKEFNTFSKMYSASDSTVILEAGIYRGHDVPISYISPPDSTDYFYTNLIAYNFYSDSITNFWFGHNAFGSGLRDLSIENDSTVVAFYRSGAYDNPYAKSFYCPECDAQAGIHTYPPDFWLLKLGSKTPRNEILKNFGRVYPNPTLGANNLTVVAEEGKNISQIRLITTLGQILRGQQNTDLEAPQLNFQLPPLSDGVYFIQVQHTDGTTYIHRLEHHN